MHIYKNNIQRNDNHNLSTENMRKPRNFRPKMVDFADRVDFTYFVGYMNLYCVIAFCVTGLESVFRGLLFLRFLFISQIAPTLVDARKTTSCSF